MTGFQKAFMAAVVGVAVAMSAGNAEAQRVPQFLVHQGRLQDRAMMPIRGMQSLTYRIYSAAAGGMALWTEPLTVSFDEGYFSVQLGDTVPFPANLFDGTARYLSVQVGMDPEMSPRQLIGSVPYALVAGNAVGDLTPRTVTLVESTG